MATETAAGLENTASMEELAAAEEGAAPMAEKKEEESLGEGLLDKEAVTTTAEGDSEDKGGGLELEAAAALVYERKVLTEDSLEAKAVWRLQKV